MIEYIINFITVFAVSFYLITALQWYSYKIDRIIFKYSKYQWHLIYFVLPIVLYHILDKYYGFYLVFYIISLFLWYKKLDKPLVFTARVKRFFFILLIVSLLNIAIKSFYDLPLTILAPILLTLFISAIVEIIIFNNYKKEAKNKLKLVNPKIVAITASYGKTSIKNYLYQLLEHKFNVYKTPRSVNTLKGIVADINNNLSANTDIYIVEAGARQKGDIKEIAEFLNHQYAIIGKIGPQHIEYFKTIDNIIATKKEILLSKNLKKCISYDIDECLQIKDKIKNIKATLDGITWEIDNKKFFAPILGEFNALNISLAYFMAKNLGVAEDELLKRISNLKPIPHRLEKIEAGGKIIIDDSFNGNIEGMLAAIKLVENYNGRKIIVTPGLVEATKELNEKLAKRIDEVFDIAIITGELNREILCSNITRPNKIYLGDKSKLQQILADNTKAGDLILFSNDAPSFI